ncbi:ABC transporter substrate-binding protein [Mangrovitalea sediminis]|uniref:ABC transporter substrate-binding protein n=1 Tax=Mangrovitalea sediminis TaxID=1982043 RepID=UPI000BE5F0C1|nr:ABC transporter substrate-binding protein [Mangrovitalea sediminis]
MFQQQQDRHFRRTLSITALALTGSLAFATTSQSAQAAEPIPVGVIGPSAHIDGRAIFQAAEMAVDEINAAGGIDGRKIELHKYDDQFQATNAVRAYQRAVQQDHVVAMTGVFLSEVGLAMQPWSGRLKTPLIISGAASTKIDQNTHAHYDRFKYTFHTFTNSTFIAKVACDFAHDVLVGQLGYKTAAIFSENAAWTKPVDAEYEKCLPKAGLKVVDKIGFEPNTTDFRPIFNKVQDTKPQVLMTAIAHVGAKAIVQWHQQQVPALMAGANGQGGSSAFWKATNGATDGVIVGTTGAAGAPVTDKTPKFYEDYKKRFGEEPAYDAYTEYDTIYTLKAAIEKAHSTDGAKLVEALEKVKLTGVSGPISFYGPKDAFTHDVVYTPGVTTGVYFQWQDGKQVAIWPPKLAQGKVKLPSFVKAAQ